MPHATPSRRRPRSIASLGALTVALALAGGTVTTAASAAPAGRGPDGSWSVTRDGSGSRITLQLPAPLEVRDAAPELAVDGRVLGPAAESPDGKTLSVVTPDDAVSPSSVQVAWNGQVPGAEAPTRPGATPAPPRGPAKKTAVDPSTRGAYAVQTTDYDFGDSALSLPGIGNRPAELRGRVYLPQGAPGKRPVVMFQHGRHSACYNATTRRTSNTVWPCPTGEQPIQSYTGYDGPAEVLASNGYVVVSVSANGINATDNPYSEDRGAQARAELVLASLDMLADADRGRGRDPLNALLRNRLDMSDVGLMGHSRGGEGVVEAALQNAKRPAPYGIRAVLPLAPVDFARSTLPAVPMSVLLPYCDGDVSNQQGQHFYDDSRYAVTGDPAGRSSLMIGGTNHNFFNTEWTPGVSVAPSNDDWSGRDPACSTASPTRLSAAEQYAVGTAYIAGFFRLVQGGETGLLPMFDGSGAVPASAGRAVVDTVAQAPSRDRVDVARLDGSSPFRVSGAATAATCASMLDRSPQSGLPDCADVLTTSQAPSWTPATYAGNVVATPVLRMGWTGADGAVTVDVPAADRDVRKTAALSFRTARDEAAVGDVDLSVLVRDGAGRTAATRVSEVSPALTPYPGTISPLPKTWLRTVRVATSSLTGIDLKDVRSITLQAATPTGGAYVSDVAFSSSAVGTESLTRLPQVSLADATVDEGDGPSTARMTVTLDEASREPVRVAVQWLSSGTAAGMVTPAASEVTVPAGATTAVVEVPFTGNDVPATAAQSFQVVASVPTASVVDDAFARLVVQDDDV